MEKVTKKAKLSQLGEGVQTKPKNSEGQGSRPLKKKLGKVSKNPY